MAQTSVRQLSSLGCTLAVMATILLSASGVDSATSDGGAPPAAAPPVHPHQLGEEHINYFYSPAEFLQLCAEFPSLSACQQEAGSLVEKRKSAYMRFGRSAPEMEDQEAETAMEKRKSAYMRFGKRSSPVVEEMGPEMKKRKSAYMRFGKRKSAYMRFGKRSSPSDQMNEMEKRKSAYMRFGKRSSPAEEEGTMAEMEKRKSAYMRFGKRR